MLAFLRPFIPYLLAAAIAAGAVLWVRGLMTQRDNAIAALAAAERELETLRVVSEWRAMARDEALAEAERLREAQAAFDDITDMARRSPDHDDPIPPLLADALRRLRATQD